MNYTKTLLISVIVLISFFYIFRNIEMYDEWAKTHDWSKQSPSTDAGYEKGIEYLDRHPVDCSRKGIRGFDFNLYDSRSHNYHFDYDCAGGTESDDFTINTNQGSECSYLSCYPNAFPIDCGHYPLTYFKYTRDGYGHNGHTYKCGTKPTTGPCRNIENAYTEEHKNHTEWLSLQKPLECNSNEVLTRVDYQYSNGTGRYKGRCCKK